MPTSPYGLEKLIGEQYLEIYAENYNMDYIAARFFNVYGERQDPKSPYTGVMSIFEDRAKEGKDLHIFGDGNQSRDFIYVKDLVQHLIHLAFSDHQGIFNLGTGLETTITELAKNILEKHGQPAKSIIYKDPRAGDIIRSVADITKLKASYKKD